MPPGSRARAAPLSVGSFSPGGGSFWAREGNVLGPDREWCPEPADTTHSKAGEPVPAAVVRGRSLSSQPPAVGRAGARGAPTSPPPRLCGTFAFVPPGRWSAWFFLGNLPFSVPARQCVLANSFGDLPAPYTTPTTMRKRKGETPPQSQDGAWTREGLKGNGTGAEFAPSTGLGFLL